MHVRFGALAALLAFASVGPVTAQTVETYAGLCDASAAVALGPDHFVVASDEDDVLRLYRRGNPAPLGPGLDLAAFLGGGRREADIEGAARIGDLVFWIGSHGRNSRGNARPERQVLFATRAVDGPQPGLSPHGRPFTGLLAALTRDPRLAALGLAEAARRAPEAEGGLNVEGLAATPSGALLIGFRNPLPRGRALIVPLENPGELVRDDPAPPRLGAPLLVDLEGRGIRSIEAVGAGLLIVAGPTGDAGTFALFRWSGRSEDAPQRLDAPLGDLRPEALFAVPGRNAVQILSDDGGLPLDGAAECKDLPAERQRFRSRTIELP